MEPSPSPSLPLAGADGRPQLVTHAQIKHAVVDGELSASDSGSFGSNPLRLTGSDDAPAKPTKRKLQHDDEDGEDAAAKSSDDEAAQDGATPSVGPLAQAPAQPQTQVQAGARPVKRGRMGDSAALVASGAASAAAGTAAALTKPKKQQQQDKFAYGNYDRYYSYRVGAAHAATEELVWKDPRLSLFKAEWFRGKRVLDIGCNAGYLTIAVAQQFQCSYMEGLDIDGRLIRRARQLLRDRAQVLQRAAGGPQRRVNIASSETKGDDASHQATASHDLYQFPNNVVFREQNFAAEPMAPPGVRFDTIMWYVGGTAFTSVDHTGIRASLSVAKWIHLHSGDAGIKAVFRKVYDMLEPGGRFIFEPQDWKSYKKNSNVSKAVHATYQTIKFRPSEFLGYLTGTVGFSGVQYLGTPSDAAKGFDRAIHVLAK